MDSVLKKGKKVYIDKRIYIRAHTATGYLNNWCLNYLTCEFMTDVANLPVTADNT